jgi:sec-independent protein translocase protein TatB
VISEGSDLAGFAGYLF